MMYPSPESAVMKTIATSFPDAVLAAADKSVSFKDEKTVVPSVADRAVIASSGCEQIVQIILASPA